MYNLVKKIVVCLIFVFISCSGFCDDIIIENTMNNSRLVNLTKEQYKALDTIEKRIYNNSFPFSNTVDRIEQLELDLFQNIQQGNITQRLNALKLESTRLALRGTAMTPMMNDVFNPKYINPRVQSSYYDDVGIIDGLIRVWWPEAYETLNEYRKYKEANFY